MISVRNALLFAAVLALTGLAALLGPPPAVGPIRPLPVEARP